MEDILNKLEAISQRLDIMNKRIHDVEEQSQLAEESRTVINKRLLLLDRKSDIIGGQRRKRTMGYTNITFSEEPHPCSSSDAQQSGIAMKETNTRGSIVEGGS